MKKKLLCATILFIFFVFERSFAQNLYVYKDIFLSNGELKNIDASSLGIKGSVKAVTYYRYNPYYSKYDKQNTIKFDKKGRISLYSLFNSDKTINNSVIFSYTKNKVICVAVDRNNKILRKITNEYDENMNLIRTELDHINPSQILREDIKKKFSYNKKDSLTEKLIFKRYNNGNDDYKLRFKSVFHHKDSFNLQIKEEDLYSYRDNEDSYFLKKHISKIERDSLGRVIKSEKSTKRFALGEWQKGYRTGSTKYEYDKRGNLIERDGPTFDQAIKYSYDRLNRPIEKIGYSNKHLYQYNEKGLVSNIKTYKLNGEPVFEEIIEYDKKGNWSKIVMYQYDKGNSNKNLNLIYLYEYEYY